MKEVDHMGWAKCSHRDDSGQLAAPQKRMEAVQMMSH